MRLILSRHGNTFEEGSDPVWVGGRDDVPLVDKGREQAKALANYIKEQDIDLAAIYVSPLQRVKEYGEIVAENLGLPAPRVDEILSEVDYGKWSGKTTAQVIDEFGQEALDAWRKYGDWPEGANWQPGEQQVIDQIEAFSQHLLSHYKHEDNVLVISSNGILRYFLTLIPGQFDKHKDMSRFRVTTGNICQFRHESGQFKKNFWNINPAETAQSTNPTENSGTSRTA